MSPISAPSSARSGSFDTSYPLFGNPLTGFEDLAALPSAGFPDALFQGNVDSLAWRESSADREIDSLLADFGGDAIKLIIRR
jgi:hypothetical protein